MSTGSTTNSTEEGGSSSFVQLALIVAVPCGTLIAILVTLILLTFCLILRSSGHDSEAEEEGHLQQQRLRKGLSLKAQREEEERQGQKRRAPKVRHKEEEETEGQRHKRRTTRAQQRQEEEEREGRKKRAKKKKLFKEKEAIHQVPSSASLDPSEQPHYVQAVGLQDWHVRMARSGRASVEALTIDTDLDSEAPSHRRASGAVNPLLLRELENYPGYELPMERGGQQQQQLGRPDSTSEEEDSSDESLNPYD